MLDFDDIIGHQRIKDRLIAEAASKRPRHAYIFDGTEGVGRQSTALAFARLLNCEEGGSKACKKCGSCVRIAEGYDLDVITVQREKRDITVDVIREQINQKIVFAPHLSRYKVFIMPEADKMNVAAQNALLKTLEEPPEYALFILITSNCGRLLPTVLSRCAVIKFDPLPMDAVRAYLAKETALSPDEANIYALYSRGSIEKAMELQSSESFKELRRYTKDICSRLLNADLIEVFEIAEGTKQYKDNYQDITGMIRSYFRDALIWATTRDMKHIINADNVEFIKNLADRLGVRVLLLLNEELTDMEKSMRTNGDFQLLCEELFLKMKEK